MGLCPKTPTHRNARPESQSDGFPERGLNGAYKVPQAHLPPPGLPRFGGGERPPFLCKPPAPLTITMGRRPGSLQTLTPREFCSRFLIARPSGPLYRLGKGGGGKGQMRLRLPWERFCAQYGLIFDYRQKSIRIQHSQRQGSWGSAPSVFC